MPHRSASGPPRERELLEPIAFPDNCTRHGQRNGLARKKPT